MVYCSEEHEWFLESKSSRSNEKSDWYLWQNGKTSCQCYWNPFLCGAEERVENDCCGAVQYPPNNWQSLIGGNVSGCQKVVNKAC